MKIIVCNKLVRDNIPEIIRGDGDTPIVEQLPQSEYSKVLVKKLGEEVKEFQDNPCEEELADIMEVIDTIFDLDIINKSETEKIKKEKFKSHGGFKRMLALKGIMDSENPFRKYNYK